MGKGVAFVLIDGVGDVNIPELGGLTPLQAADTPHLDAIAAGGVNGLMDPVEPGLACGSDTAHLSIFGYDPRLVTADSGAILPTIQQRQDASHSQLVSRFYRGRGAFESMGAGLAMQPGDIAFKSNFATLNDRGIVVKRRADRRFEEEGPRLCHALDGLELPSFPEHRVSVQYATEHRCGVVVSGPGLSDSVSGTDPLKDNLPLQAAEALEDTSEARLTAALVAELSDQMQSILQEHEVNKERVAAGKLPANVVLLRGCGSRIHVPGFRERHRLKACMVAPTKIIAGLGSSLGIDVLDVPGATGDYQTDLSAKAQAVCKSLTEDGYEFSFLHVKAVDDTGHDRATVLKIRYFEAIDMMVQQLLQGLTSAERGEQGNYGIVVTGDHSTPVVFGDHSFEPVPFAASTVSLAAREILPRQRSEPRKSDFFKIDQPAPSELQPPLEILGKEAARRRYHTWHPSGALIGDYPYRFDEISASHGSLGRFPGSQAISIVQNLYQLL